MIGISVAAKIEWQVVLEYFDKQTENCLKYPFGEYFETTINNKNVIIFKSGARKVNSSSSTQYMIDKFNLEKVIVIGTCAGIDDKYKNLDIFIPNKAVQYDCTVKEIEPFIKESFIVEFDLKSLNFKYNIGTIGTSDKAVVMWKDYLELKNNDITIADTESGAIAYVCKMNNVKCIIIKGISDFPTNEELSSKEISNEEQINVFIKNTPIVMNNILENYLPKVI